MIVLAGPNGAGKSTRYKTRAAPRFAGTFINADIIRLDELGNPSPAASYETAGLATAHRADFLAQGRDFVTETVFSHPSKIDLVHEAREKGFTINVMHVGVNSPGVSVARVNVRCSHRAGGEDPQPTCARRRSHSRGRPQGRPRGRLRQLRPECAAGAVPGLRQRAARLGPTQPA